MCSHTIQSEAEDCSLWLLIGSSACMKKCEFIKSGPTFALLVIIVFVLLFHFPQPMVVPNAALHHASISASSTQVVSEVLSKMLMVGITDPGTYVYRYVQYCIMFLCATQADISLLLFSQTPTFVFVCCHHWMKDLMLTWLRQRTYQLCLLPLMMR